MSSQDDFTDPQIDYSDLEEKQVPLPSLSPFSLSFPLFSLTSRSPSPHSYDHRLTTTRTLVQVHHPL